MGKESRKPMILILALTIYAFGWAMKVEALEPRLLWKKAIPFEIGSIKMARQSGDVILSNRDARQIILYDRKGIKRFHWGPRIDRQPMGIDLSDDGSIIRFSTSRTEEFSLKSKTPGWDSRIHYVTRKGKELWNRGYLGAAYLSPDGKMVAIGTSAGEGGNLTILDSEGRFLWKYISREADNIVFSPDSNYLLFSGEEGLHLLDKSGNLLWKKGDAFQAVSVSEGATYVTTGDKKVYDKHGNIIFKGDARISGDGKWLLVVYPDKISIMTLSDRTVKREYPGGGFLSHDGRFLTALSPSGNQLIIDTVNQVSSEIPIKNISVSRVLNTKDGKYLLFAIGHKKLLFYQVY